MEIYTTKPILRASGKEVRGRWVKAIDPDGAYGGPYSDYMNLLHNPNYMAKMEDIQAEKRVAMGVPSRSRSRSASRKAARKASRKARKVTRKGKGKGIRRH